MSKRIITRRQLLKEISLVTAGSALLMNFPLKSFAQKATDKSRVILIRNKDLIDDAGVLNASVMQDMLDEAICLLTGEKEVQKAWGNITKPEDIVGIKTNQWQYLSTPKELEQAIQKRVIGTGVKEVNISIDDRGVLKNPVFQKATALINSRPMRAHYWAGVGSLLKNYIMFAEHPSDYHPDTCADLAKIWKLPVVEGKTKLNVLVMITPLFHGTGPNAYSKEYTWSYKGLIVGFDPVACDSVGLRIIQAKRLGYFGEDRPINPPAHHISLADTRHHLGNANPDNIELIKSGWQEGILL